MTLVSLFLLDHARTQFLGKLGLQKIIYILKCESYTLNIDKQRH